MNDRAAAARATLQVHGVDVAALDAGTLAAEALQPALADADAVAIVDALAAVGTPHAAQVLAALEAAAPTGAVRRAIRGALFKLKQRGVAVEAAPAPPSAATPARRPTHFEGFLTAFDGRGDRIGWLVHTPPGGATTLVIAVLNEPAGLRDVRATTVARKQLRAARDRFRRDQGIVLVPVDGDVLDALLVEAHERVTATRERAQDYLRLRRDLTGTPPRPPAEPTSRRVPALDTEAEAGALARSADLLNEPELAGWWPVPEQLAPFAQEVREMRDSPIVLAPAQQEQRLRTIVDQAARTLYPPEVLARRLEGSAYVFAETGRGAAAALALGVARTLRSAPAVADVPITGALVHRALGTMLASETTAHEEERKEALIVTPGEALRARSPSRPPHTRG